ncbi:MAG: diacylglycerol kinase family lipid kinase [Candidatus Riflebacteria bacterium]|nr:diacylglycerol kinase family lipid kinase [Candidatus Riflebacteria bacterium]
MENGPENISVIANPNAGRKNSVRFNAAMEFLKSKSDTTVHLTSFPGEAEILARKISQSGKSLVVACGGDGTINEVANGLNPDSILGIIPAGTANVIARELGIPLDLVEASKALFSGAVKKTDCGHVGKRKFLMVAGFGFDAHVSGKVNPMLKKIFRIYSYHLQSALMYLSYSRPKIAVASDKETLDGEFALFANMRRYGGELFFAENARFDDGMLDLVLFKKFNPQSVLIGLLGAKMRKGVPEKIAFRRRAEKFFISSSSLLPYQLDGEAFPGVLSSEVRLDKKAVLIIVP